MLLWIIHLLRPVTGS